MKAHVRVVTALVLALATLAAPTRAAPQAGPRAGRHTAVSKDQYLAAMNRALDELELALGPAAARGTRPRVHANLFLAHEALIATTPVETLTRVVDAFKDAGIAQVDLNVGLHPWADGDRSAIAKYDAIVERIRASGMRVAVNPQYSPVLRRIGSVDEWQRSALPVFAEIAGRYKPDVFVVVHEPTTMAARMGVQATPSRWADFARAAAAAVKEKSPGSRIGAGGLATEQEYFRAFAGLREVDVLTLDIYDLRSLETYAEMARVAGQRGKPVYVEETWRPPYYQPRPGLTPDQVAVQGVGDRAFEPLDVKWVRLLASWAAAQRVEAITPVWMQAFFAYGGDGTDAFDPPYLRAVAAAVQRDERTRTFEAIRELARGRD